MRARARASVRARVSVGVRAMPRLLVEKRELELRTVDLVRVRARIGAKGG